VRARLAVAATALTACVALWTLQGDQTGRVESHLLVYGAAFGAYLVGLQASRGLSTGGLRVALGLAIGWRVALVLAPPLLSDDVNRYVWEGRLQHHGGNPYLWTDRPEAEKWASLRDAVWAGVNHKDYTAIYPPLWQLAARGVVALDDSVTAMKAFVVACELATLGVLAALLQRRGLPRERLLVLAWSPLALVEIAGSGHNEALGTLCLAASLLALDAGWPLASAISAALGFQAKLLPGLVAAAWARRYRPRHVLAAAASVLLLTLPYLSAGAGLWMSLGKYSQLWRFNETLFAPLATAFGQEAASRVSAGSVLAIALSLAWRRTEPVAAALVVVVASLALAANVLPWYALWLVPLLVLHDQPGALLFTGTVGLAYLVYPAWRAGEPWHIGWGVRALEYGPCLALALWSSWTRSSSS
jgi:hypothetical protein